MASVQIGTIRDSVVIECEHSNTCLWWIYLHMSDQYMPRSGTAKSEDKYLSALADKTKHFSKMIGPGYTPAIRVLFTNTW